jgi:hypothetical protein
MDTIFVCTQPNDCLRNRRRYAWNVVERHSGRSRICNVPRTKIDTMLSIGRGRLPGEDVKALRHWEDSSFVSFVRCSRLGQQHDGKKIHAVFIENHDHDH